MADEEYVHYRGPASEGVQTSLCGLPSPPPDLLTLNWLAVTCKTCIKHKPTHN